MKRRPAEKAGLLGAAAVLTAAAFGAGEAAIAAVGAVAGAAPYAITVVIDNGGIVGVARQLWTGRKKGPSD